VLRDARALADVCLAGRQAAVEVIGEALLAVEGYRRVAERLGVPADTVRDSWLRFGSRAEAIAAHFLVWARALDGSPDPPVPAGSREHLCPMGGGPGVEHDAGSLGPGVSPSRIWGADPRAAAAGEQNAGGAAGVGMRASPRAARQADGADSQIGRACRNVRRIMHHSRTS
jgi:hypothetical protein